MLLGDNDGWHQVKDQQHYFYTGCALCLIHKKIPKDAIRDNDEKLHCKTCEQKVNKMLAVAESIVGKKLSPKEILKLIEVLDSIKIGRGLVEKTRTLEGGCAVIGHADGTKSITHFGVNLKKEILK